MSFDIFRKLKKDKNINQFINEDKRLIQKKYLSFKNLLSGNNRVLEIMADMEEKFSGEYLFDRHYIDSNSETLSKMVYSIIENLNEISSEKYAKLYEVFGRIDLGIKDILTKKVEIPVTEFTIPLENVDKEMVAVVGGKNANLGEVENRLKLPVPDGFAVTAYAFKRFMEHNNLMDGINRKLYSLDLKDMERLSDISREVQELITDADLPDDLRKAILNAYDELMKKVGKKVSVSVRSSAVQEDGEFSFAGQYTTALGVQQKDLILKKYKEILASLFTHRAIFYYKSKGFKEEDMIMSVGIMTMVDARTSGVMYSHDPTDPHKNVIIINAVWGLGTSAVDGHVTPDTYIVSKTNNVILEKKAAAQKTMLAFTPDKGVVEVELTEDMGKKSCLSDEQTLTLANFADVLEKHFNKPQDIEWAIDRDDNIYILQTRPLRISARASKPKPIPTRVDGYKILIEKGIIACKGIASGKAFLVKNEEDLNDFPAGAVLVARHTSTKFVTVMDKASAIITDVGSATGHMASLSREFQVPTILNTSISTEIIKNGQEITVDAINCNIYEGRVDSIIEMAAKRENHFRSTPLFKTLRRVLKRIAPLNLIDPVDKEFSIENCKTFHDITRFAHEKAMAEMFKISDQKEIRKGDAVKLVLKIPLDVSLIDIGQGIEEGYKKIIVQNILSRPMKAFLKGMMSVKWPEPKPADMKSIPSAAQEGQLHEKSFAMVSKEYMNFNIRLGYHLSTVEAYAGENTNDNYIQFFFKGGGASLDRRLRRTALIKEILGKLDFRVRCTGDVLEGKITKYEEDAIMHRLDVLGRFTVYTKQLDMAMFSDSMVEWFKEEFLKEHYQSA